VILVRPQEEGNVGAAARAMANMGLSRLILVEPAPEPGPMARAMAVRAGDILERADRAPSLRQAIAPFRRVVGTTSTRSRSLSAPLLSPREAAARIAAEPASATALVFGPEVSGLTNDELALCGLLVRIPAAAVQPTLNLAQAVLILAYEVYLAGRRDLAAVDAGEAPAPAREIDGLFDQLAPLLEQVGFARDDTFPGVLRDLRQLAARAAPGNREVKILRGLCRRASRHLSVD
jgi:TrmH family RNA methyltransferase